ncbi:MAG: glycoside hydrolase family 2 TIM barrel-domain containing protein [Breznakibacter sp.]
MKKLFILIPLALATLVQAQPGTETLYLSGKDNRSTVEWDFYCTAGRNSGKWDKIIVPSCWEQQGYGTYDYGRDYHTYGKKFQFADEQGFYKTKFSVPKKWDKKRVVIVFEGVMTDAEVKVNGQLAGDAHQGAFYRFSYDITDKIKVGAENLLEVNVKKMSDNKMVNRAERYADYWVFGGIFRPVYLQAYPQEYIERTAIAAEADGAYYAKVYTNHVGGVRQLTLKIKDVQGHVVSQASSQINNGDAVADVKGTLANPLRWTAETPHLYTVELTLWNKGKAIHTITEKIGFRTIEVRKKDGIYLNGTKIKMKGINRHVFWPESGRTVNADIDMMDVRLVKEMNMNSIRCSHYPPDKDFLNICDSLGIYVIDELAGWQNAYDTGVGRKLVKEMVARDVNHPSIIFWSNGNEGGHNRELEPDYKLWDHSSRVLIRAHHKPGNHLNGIDCNHYEDYYSSRSIMDAGDNIYMPTEFNHCQDDGGGGAGLSDFWEQMWAHPLSGGGYLWVLFDEAIARTDMYNALDANRVNANDGVLGPHREKEGSYYAIRDIFTPVKISLSQLPNSFSGQVEVENRFFFTNLKECRFKVELIDFRNPTERLHGSVVKKSYTLPSPDVRPGNKGNLSLALPTDWTQYDAVRLYAFDNHDNEVAQWTWKTKSNLQLVSLIGQQGSGNVEIGDSLTYYSLKAAGIALVIDKNTGLLDKINTDLGYNLSFGNGPVLVKGEAKVVSVHPTDNGVEALFEGNLKYARWTMMPGGWVKFDYEYTLNDTVPFAGISFSYPESNVIGAKWLGRGPARVWKNREFGGTLDVWENLYNNTRTGQTSWIYPEFKGYFSDMVWAELNTAEGRILVVSEQDDLYLRLFDFHALSGKVPHPELPVGDVSFLDAIPPTGTKMATNLSTNTAQLGPNSELNVMNRTVKRTLYFYFGWLGPDMYVK